MQNTVHLQPINKRTCELKDNYFRLLIKLIHFFQGEMGNKQTIFTEEDIENYMVRIGATGGRAYFRPLLTLFHPSVAPPPSLALLILVLGTI